MVRSHVVCSAEPGVSRRDISGVSYEYPRDARNGSNVRVGDLFVCYVGEKHADGGRRVFGVGRIGLIDGAGVNYVAVYDRYKSIAEPWTFAELGGDPRSNLRNPINAISTGLTTLILAKLGYTSTDELPELPSDQSALSLACGGGPHLSPGGSTLADPSVLPSGADETRADRCDPAGPLVDLSRRSTDGERTP